MKNVHLLYIEREIILIKNTDIPDENKSKKQLISEVKKLKQQIASAEKTQQKSVAKNGELEFIHDIYRRAIENARGVPYLLKFQDNTYDFFGEGLEKTLGITHDELNYKILHNMMKEVIVTGENGPSDPKEYRNFFRKGKLKHYRVDLRMQLPSGEEKWLSDSSIPIHNDSDNLVVGSLGILQDITERKQTEKKAVDSLRKKEILLKEIHHRIKNNLQVVSSLLNLQSDRIENEKLNKVFDNCKNKIRTMALIHEIIYRSGDFSRIDTKKYIKTVTHNLVYSYNKQDKVNIDFAIQDIKLSIDSAVPFGLILNELLSNSLKHAFPDNRSGYIFIRLSSNKNGVIELIVQDDGIGIPKDFDLHKTTSFGLTLVESLVKQIKGKWDMSSKNGVKIKITFKSQDDIPA